jgi:signal transduction histidine kinase
VNSNRESHGDLPIGIATMPANQRQRRLALAAILCLSAGVVVTAPFASLQIARIDAFVPVLQTVLCVADFITASLLFAQYSVQPHRAILVLASGYVCSGSFAFLQTLAFPGAYAPNGLIGNGIDTPAWLFILWHTTFPTLTIFYALLKDKKRIASTSQTSSSTRVGITIASVLVAIFALTWMVTEHIAYLPAMYTGGVTRQTHAAHIANVGMLLLGVTAFIFLFVRRRSILDTWLIVTLFAWMPNFLIASLLTFVRFSVGWYVARGYALIASCTLLIVLLTETTVLHARLVSAIALLWRERANQLVGVDAATAALAHEIRQPLTGIVTRGSAALNWLARTPPDLEKVRASVEAMIDATGRVDQVISTVRGVIKRTSTQRTTIDAHDLIQEVLTLAEHDLQVHGILVSTDFEKARPKILGNRTLLQQVILNLIRNAIESMEAVQPRARRLRLATRYDGKSGTLLRIEDSGRGVSVDDRDRIFDTFFTTKPTGTGLGLSICRTIVEEHGGELRLARTDDHGAIFEMILPAVPTNNRRVLYKTVQ